MRRDRGRLGVAVAYPLDPGAGSAAGAVRRPDALSDGRGGAGAGVPGGRRRGSGDPSPSHVQDRRGAASAGEDEAAADRRRGDRGDPGFNLHSELRGRRAAAGGSDRQCRDGERTTAGLRRRGEDRHGSRRPDPPQPRCGRADRGHSADGVYRRLSRAAAHSSRRWRRGASDTRLVSCRHAAAAPDADCRRPVVRWS